MPLSTTLLSVYVSAEVSRTFHYTIFTRIINVYLLNSTLKKLFSPLISPISFMNKYLWHVTRVFYVVIFCWYGTLPTFYHISFEFD